MDYEQLLELVKDRRSTRRFKPDAIPQGAVEKIIEVARWAPSGFNLQPWEFVIVNDRKLKDGIVQFCHESMANAPRMETTRETWQGAVKPPPGGASGEGGDYSVAPVFILLLGDTRTNIGLPMYRRYNEALKQEAFRGGLSSAFLYMHLAASSLGLGSQWVSAVTTPYAQCMIKNLLGIPGSLEIYDMMVLGYPAIKTPPRPVREKEKMVHYNYCGAEAFRKDEEVKDFIKMIRS